MVSHYQPVYQEVRTWVESKYLVTSSGRDIVTYYQPATSEQQEVRTWVQSKHLVTSPGRDMVTHQPLVPFSMVLVNYRMSEQPLFCQQVSTAAILFFARRLLQSPFCFVCKEVSTATILFYARRLLQSPFCFVCQEVSTATILFLFFARRLLQLPFCFVCQEVSTAAILSIARRFQQPPFCPLQGGFNSRHYVHCKEVSTAAIVSIARRFQQPPFCLMQGGSKLCPKQNCSCQVSQMLKFSGRWPSLAVGLIGSRVLTSCHGCHAALDLGI